MPPLNIDALAHVDINLLREKAAALAVTKSAKKMFAKVFHLVAAELEAQALLALHSGHYTLTTLRLSVSDARQRAHDLRVLANFQS